MGFDGRAVQRGRFFDGVPEERHAQSDFGRARIGDGAVANGQELLPDAQRGRHGHLARALCAITLQGQLLAPDAHVEDALRAEHHDIRRAGGDGFAACMKGHQRAGCRARHDRGARIHGPIIVVQPGRNVHEILTGQIGYGVQHMRAGVEHEAPAGDFRLLPPGVRGVRPPVLPDGSADPQEGPQLARPQHLDGGLDLRRQTAGERDHQQSAGAVPRCDQAARFLGVHHHRLFQQHIQPGFHAGQRLIVMIGVRRDDERGVQLVAVLAEQLAQIRLIDGGRGAGFHEDRLRRFVLRLRRLAHDRDRGRVGLRSMLRM